MTACLTGRPRYASAVSFILTSTAEPTSDGEILRPCASTHASPDSALAILYAFMRTIFCTSGSSNRRPISRFVAANVLVGLVTACRLAGAPTSRVPSACTATIDGVVRAPSAFSITRTFLPCGPRRGEMGGERAARNNAAQHGPPPSRTSMIATQELVVPKSMPIMSLRADAAAWNAARLADTPADSRTGSCAVRRRGWGARASRSGNSSRGGAPPAGVRGGGAVHAAAAQIAAPPLVS